MIHCHSINTKTNYKKIAQGFIKPIVQLYLTDFTSGSHVAVGTGAQVSGQARASMLTRRLAARYTQTQGCKQHKDTHQYSASSVCVCVCQDVRQVWIRAQVTFLTGGPTVAHRTFAHVRFHTLPLVPAVGSTHGWEGRKVATKSDAEINQPKSSEGI